ncbi:inositol monophosphatase family protein [Parvibaculum sp.]|uniref:inositol monophosphatase family protein n=1 Tax=Parvibaculum sp. TaxID=2024848 RepID=UPI00272251BC|nr:inositol monophosphatase family protein [Parvibaculum sp.]MDO9126711.1 inositol monophosphatase family protein [Parvibaculum sp.]MDP2151768.1 inositol monophosphatase family protein [Parvibaculum sp.]MDP3328436.1 inositol monophosphatase family protein [Parvibaculum sp.]
MSRHTPSMSVMVAAARKAARGLQRDFGEVENLQVSLKGPANFVTAADKKAEKVIFQELSKARPGYGFLMEEGGVVEGADKSHRWIIDPLDGTTNFLHGIPMFSISIGLEREGQIVAGLVYNPISDEMFIAEKGQGAFLNDRRIRVAARRELAQSVVACGTPDLGRPEHERYLTELRQVMLQVAGVRRMGSAALDLAYVAAGRFDAYWEANLAPWDVAAGIILVREAGGFVSDLSGREDMLKTGGILAGNETLHRQLGDVLKKAHKPAV